MVGGAGVFGFSVCIGLLLLVHKGAERDQQKGTGAEGGDAQDEGSARRVTGRRRGSRRAATRRERAEPESIKRSDCVAARSVADENHHNLGSASASAGHCPSLDFRRFLKWHVVGSGEPLSAMSRGINRHAFRQASGATFGHQRIEGLPTCDHAQGEPLPCGRQDSLPGTGSRRIPCELSDHRQFTGTGNDTPPSTAARAQTRLTQPIITARLRLNRSRALIEQRCKPEGLRKAPPGDAGGACLFCRLGGCAVTPTHASIDRLGTRELARGGHNVWPTSRGPSGRAGGQP